MTVAFIYSQTKHVSAEAIEAIWLSFSTKLDFKEADESCEGKKDFIVLSVSGVGYLCSFNRCFAFVVIVACSVFCK